MAPNQKAKQRLRVYERDGGSCFYCGVRTIVSFDAKAQRPPPNLATLDHIVPRSKGGMRTAENSVCACLSCNNMRGDMPADKFLMMFYGRR